MASASSNNSSAAAVNEPIVPSAADLNELQVVGRRTCVPEPPNEEEKRVIWRSQVFIPLRIGDFFHAFLGPAKKPEKAFPTNHRNFHLSEKGEELILAFRDQYNMPFLSDPLRVFRSAPPSPFADKSAYLHWVNRVQAEKGPFWKDMGIFDLIQLLKTKITYNPAMLLSALFFWERATNCFHVPFGVITPTLLDVAAITGLQPCGLLYHDLEPQTPISLLAKPGNDFIFSNFIKIHNPGSGPVTDQEHVAFFALLAFSSRFLHQILETSSQTPSSSHLDS